MARWEWLMVGVAAMFGTAVAAAPIVTTYQGLCDASAVTRIGNRFVVATDEVDKSSGRNTLHMFTEGNPVGSVIELTAVLGTKQKEADLEGVARIGDKQYWIGSHSTNQKGEAKPGRRVLFATATQGNSLVAVAGVYRTLVDDLTADPRYEKLGIAAAAGRAPETKNGLSIEGLTAVGTTLLIGLRSPVIDGKALIVPLLDAPAVVAGAAAAKFGAPLLVNLDGRGIRDLTSLGNATLILAGPVGNKRDFKLFVLNGQKLSKGPKVDFGDLRVEGMASGADGSLLFVSDDGDEPIGGTACKDLPDSERRFRVLMVKP